MESVAAPASLDIHFSHFSVSVNSFTTLTLFPSFDLFSRFLHEFGESAGQFVNALRLPPLNRLGGNQLRADADCGCSRQNEVGRSLLIDASCGNQGNLRQGRVQRLDVLIAADRRAGKDFDEVSAGAPCRDHFGWRHCTRQDCDVFLGREFHDRGIE